MRAEPGGSPGCGVTEKDGGSDCSVRRTMSQMNPAEKGLSVKSGLNVTSSLSDSTHIDAHAQPSDKGQRHKYQLT